MGTFNRQTIMLAKKLQRARLTMMRTFPFYAVLLLHIRFAIDDMCTSVYTDGEKIVFCPSFLEELSDLELEFVLMHEVLHIAFHHCFYSQDDYDFDDFGTACDIIVNSNILSSFDGEVKRITLQNYGESMHLAPNGKEGVGYSVPEIYSMLRIHNRNENREDPDAFRFDGGFDDHTFWYGDEEEATEEEESNSDEGNSDEEDLEADGGPGKNAKNGDAGQEGAGGEGEGQGQDGEGGEGEGQGQGGEGRDSEGAPGSGSKSPKEEGHFSKSEMQEVWLQRILEAEQIVKQIDKAGGRTAGRIPLGIQRLIKEFTQPQIDWRSVLDSFIQEEVVDYSFNPPDRRLQDCPFLLPDFNELDTSVKDILFMIDSSGSMSDKMIQEAYSEINGAIQQFNGKLQGWLGFFDANVVEPVPFADEEEFKIIRPKGGGGTSFTCIFKYVEKHMDTLTPASIVILTDGFASWPEESEAMGIPVLWVINNDHAKPPWGKVVRIEKQEEFGLW